MRTPPPQPHRILVTSRRPHLLRPSQRGEGSNRGIWGRNKHHRSLLQYHPYRDGSPDHLTLLRSLRRLSFRAHSASETTVCVTLHRLPPHRSTNSPGVDTPVLFNTVPCTCGRSPNAERMRNERVDLEQREHQEAFYPTRPRCTTETGPRPFLNPNHRMHAHQPGNPAGQGCPYQAPASRGRHTPLSVQLRNILKHLGEIRSESVRHLPPTVGLQTDILTYKQ